MINSKAGALSKWCPFSRQVWADFDAAGAFTTLGDTPAFNMVHENRGQREHRIPCIADGCMMWRSVGHIGLPASGSYEAERVELGYCGLAGDPIPLAHVKEALAVLQRHAAQTAPSRTEPAERAT